MRKPILIAFIGSLVLTGCSVDWNDSKDREIAGLKKEIKSLMTASESKSWSLTETTLFDKRTKCGTLTAEIEKRTEALNKEFPNLWKFSNGGSFYSPSKDACLWIRITSSYAKDGSPMERRALYEFGNDQGTADPIIGCEKMVGEDRGVDGCGKWGVELAKFQWENEGGNLLR